MTAARCNTFKAFSVMRECTPLLTRLLASIFPISDGSTRYSGMTFADGSSLERNTRVSARVLDSLYDLAEKHCREAESVEIQAVSIRRDSPDPEGSYFFTLETDGYDWFLSFGAVLDGTGGYTQGENGGSKSTMRRRSFVSSGKSSLWQG